MRIETHGGARRGRVTWGGTIVDTRGRIGVSMVIIGGAVAAMREVTTGRSVTAGLMGNH